MFRGARRLWQDGGEAAEAIPQRGLLAMAAVNDLAEEEERADADVDEDENDEISVLDEQSCATLARFIPSHVLRKLEPGTPDAPLKPYVELIPHAAIMCLDVSGYTKMCEQFSRGKAPSTVFRANHPSAEGGSATSQVSVSVASATATALFRMSNENETAGFGAESVRLALSSVFGKLIEIVDQCGGDVLRIAGDALFVLFPLCSNLPLGPSLSMVALCGCTCASADLSCSVEGLSVHVGIGYGAVQCLHVGSAASDLGFQMVVSGPPFKEQVAPALEATSPGEVAVSDCIWENLEGMDCWEATAPANGNAGVWIISANAAALLRGGAGSPLKLKKISERASLIASVETGMVCSKEKLWTLHAYAPLPVRKSIVAERSGLLAEISRVSVLFVMLDLGLEWGLDDLQSAFSQLQVTMGRHGGSIKELSVDDKGLVLVAGFGLSHSIGPSPSSCACLSALEIEENLRTLGWRAGMGIATGPVFCASLGSELRREYAMVGDTVNLAARLMGARMKGSIDPLDFMPPPTASAPLTPSQMQMRHSHNSSSTVMDNRRSSYFSHGTLAARESFSTASLVDEETRRDAGTGGVVAFDEMKPISVKGKAQEVKIFVPGLSAAASKRAEQDGRGGVDRYLFAAAEPHQAHPHSHADSASVASSDRDTHPSIEIPAKGGSFSWAEGASLLGSPPSSPVGASAGEVDQPVLSEAACGALLPVMFSCDEIDPQVRDIIYVRSSCGNADYLASLCRFIQLEDLGESLQESSGGPHMFWLRSYAFADILKLASTVPPAMSMELSKRLSALSRLQAKVLAIVCVAGGHGDVELLRHILTNVSPFKEYWAETLRTLEAKRARKVPPPGGRIALLHEENLLLATLKQLEKYHFLVLSSDGGFSGSFFHCRDLLLIDHVYASLPFKQRCQLHMALGRWILVSQEREDVQTKYLPLLVHHFTQAHAEDKAQAYLTVLKVLGGTYVDNWILENVRLYLPNLGLNADPSSITQAQYSAICVLPALPGLRGLAKALRGAEVGGMVVSAVLKLRAVLKRRLAKVIRTRRRNSNTSTPESTPISRQSPTSLNLSPPPAPSLGGIDISTLFEDPPSPPRGSRRL
jgi:class 3 adenylate cyclase